MPHGRPIALKLIIREALEVQTRPFSLLVHPDSPTYLYWLQVCTNFYDFFYFLDVSEAIPPNSKLMLFDSYLTLTSQLSSSIPKAYRILGFRALVVTSEASVPFASNP